ncbi:MAG: 2'-5' RNA ligase family protein [bacterium]
MSYIDEKNTALLVLAYPEISSEDRNWIDSFRKKHDHLFYGIVEPHFTIVFPTFGICYNDFEQEVLEKTKDTKSFNFNIRCAMINNDRLSEYNHIFLSPDEGNSDIVKLHDKLYSGILRKTLRLDVDFYSHIVIGSYTDPEKCKKLIDEINSTSFKISGKISSIDIVSFGDQKVTDLRKIELL